ncbi:MAG TPA: 2-oxo-tetronate isomerase [Gemmataceae bacterium]|nr:2-oxo-tetronate isomerase [Gemmataceae bacterium]
MPKFAANVSMMFNEVSFLERFAAAAAAGFRAVEFAFPYEFPVEKIAEQLNKHRLENVLFNLPPGDLAAGDRGTACLPGRQAEFRASVQTALGYALRLKTPRLHVLAGVVPQGADPTICKATFVDNLQYAAAEVAPHGIMLMIEAINTRDIPGYYLNFQAQTHALMEEIGAPHVKMQMDCYHMQIMEGDIAMKLRKYMAHCGHVQIAGVPNRHEPDNGEVNYPYIFELLDSLGYGGWVGCEYRPAGKTVDGLGWLQSWAARVR